MAIYVSSEIISEVTIPTVEPLHFECVFVKVIFHTNKCIIIGSIYRPPSSPAETFDRLISTISSISCKNEIILLGDFNKNWLDKSSDKVKKLLSSLNLTQLIKEPTQITPTTQSLLDWILVSHPFLKCRCYV